ncbi:MAG TPA: GNAT family N-acetyltransferase [Acidimicrobiales bacterium]
MATEELVSGWEPWLPVGDTLLRRFVHCFADRVETMARLGGGVVDRGDDVVIADQRSPFGYDNAAVVLRPQADGCRDVVARANAAFPADRWWILVSAFPTPSLREQGLGLVGHPPLMFRPAGPLEITPPAELTVVEVTDAATLADFERTLIIGYPVPDEGAAAFTTAHLDALRLFVGYRDGKPVACAGSFVAHGVVEIDWVATLPSARGRGFGAALTAAAASVRPDLPTVLVASDDGRPVYQRLGFVEILRCTVWERRPPAG